MGICTNGWVYVLQPPSAHFQVTVPLPASQLSLPNFGSTGQPLIALPQTLQPPLQHAAPQAQAQSLGRPAQVSQPFRGLIAPGTPHGMVTAAGKVSGRGGHRCSERWRPRM